MNKLKINRPLMFAIATIGILGTGALTFSQVYAQTQNTTDTSSTNTTTQPANNFDPTKGGHVGTNGVKEVLLTGTDADKAKAAALLAVPGGTVDRVETDAEGAAYEAHMTKSDGSHVTVKFDSNFNVTSNESSQGPPGKARQ